MILEDCQVRPHTPTLTEKRCPRCGAVVEVFSSDMEVACDACGQAVYNDALSCVQWCRYARKCVGEEMYARMPEIARGQEGRRTGRQEHGCDDGYYYGG